MSAPEIKHSTINPQEKTAIEKVEKFLHEQDISYVMHYHPPVFTCEEAEIHCKNIPGIPGKNLFLRDKKGERFFLVILPAHKKADLKKIGTIVNEKVARFAIRSADDASSASYRRSEGELSRNLRTNREANSDESSANPYCEKISFGNPERLREKLDLYPGAVSPFGLLNDKNAEVKVYIDREMYDTPLVNFHPNSNTASVELTQEMFHKFLATLPHKIEIIEI